MTNKTKAAIDRAKYELHLMRKAAIEEAANRMIRDGETLTTAARFYLKMGMQEVIEHPERYGLYTKEQVEKAVSEGYDQAVWDVTHSLTDKQKRHE